MFFSQISPKPQKKQQPQPQQQLASLVELAKKKAEVIQPSQGDANQVQIVAGSADKGGSRQVEVNKEKTSDVAKTSPGNILC